MQEPLQITFRNFPASKSAEYLVRKKAQKLEKFFDRIVKCRVVLETQHHHNANLYDVSLDIQVPGRTFAISSAHHDDHARECLDVAIRDAFEAAWRQLQGYMGTQRERV